MALHNFRDSFLMCEDLYLGAVVLNSSTMDFKISEYLYRVITMSFVLNNLDITLNF